jgi:hypothetical protein
MTSLNSFKKEDVRVVPVLAMKVYRGSDTAPLFLSLDI